MPTVYSATNDSPISYLAVSHEYPCAQDSAINYYNQRQNIGQRIGEFVGRHKRLIAVAATAATLTSLLVGCSDTPKATKTAPKAAYQLKPGERLLPTLDNLGSVYDVTARLVDNDGDASTQVTCVESRTINKVPAGASRASLMAKVLQDDTYRPAPLTVNGQDNVAASVLDVVDGNEGQVYVQANLDDSTVNRYADMLSPAVEALNGGFEPKANRPYVVPRNCFIDEVVSTGQ